jgi:hypothetical protein
MRKLVVTVLAGVAVASAAIAQEQMRAHGAHEHGHGKLNMAIDGNRVLIELHVPGADIVGFEHTARTREDRAAVEKAMRLLKAPLALFTMPADAACRIDKAHVSLVGGDANGHADRPARQGEDGKEGHTEFQAEYALTCDRPDRIHHIAFPYFQLFAGSRELDVTVIDDRGQKRYEVERDAPAIRLERAP